MSIIAQLHIENFPDLGVDAVVEEDEREERENANADEIRPVSAEDDVPGGKERKGGITNTNIDDKIHDTIGPLRVVDVPLTIVGSLGDKLWSSTSLTRGF